MGYRSDVCMRIEYDTKEQLDKAKAQVKEFEFQPNEIDISNNHYRDGMVLTLVWYNAKWYDFDYDYTKDIMAWFKDQENGHYMRIGEDYTDVEEMVVGSPSDFISLVRRFDCE